MVDILGLSMKYVHAPYQAKVWADIYSPLAGKRLKAQMSILQWPVLISIELNMKIESNVECKSGMINALNKLVRKLF